MRKITSVFLLLLSCAFLATAQTAITPESPQQSILKSFQSKKKNAISAEPRVCFQTFPWPKGKAEGTGVDANEMRNLRDSLENYWKGNQSPVDLQQQEQKLREAFGPQDVEQHVLFADFLLLQYLQAEGRYDEAVREGISLLRRRNVEAKAVPWTPEDAVSAISSQNLKNLLFLNTARAFINTPIHSPAIEIGFIVPYLDARSGLVNVFGKLDLEDVSNQLIQRVATERFYKFDQQLPARRATLKALPYFVGAIRNDEGMLVVLQGEHKYVIEKPKHRPAVLRSGRSGDDAGDRFLRTALAADSSPDMPLFSVRRKGSGVILQFATGEEIELKDSEVMSLKKGVRLPDVHALSKAIAAAQQPLVLYSNPLAFGEKMNAEADMAYMLQRAYPEALIIRDPYTVKTREQYVRVTTLAPDTQKIAVVAEDSFAVKDYKLIQNIEDELRGRGFTIVPVQKGNVKWTQSENKLVLVITGHIDENLVQFVHALGAAGVLKDNVILFNTCRKKMSEQLASEITEIYGATAVYTFDKVITPEELEPVLKEFPDDANKPTVPFINLWHEDIKRNHMNGVWRICEQLSEPSQGRLG